MTFGWQINPLWPLIRPDRRLDFAIVSDNSGTELSVRLHSVASWPKLTRSIAVRLDERHQLPQLVPHRHVSWHTIPKVAERQHILEQKLYEPSDILWMQRA